MMEKTLIAISKAYEKEVENLKPGKISPDTFNSISAKINGENTHISELAQIVTTQNQGVVINPYVAEHAESIVKVFLG